MSTRWQYQKLKKTLAEPPRALWGNLDLPTTWFFFYSCSFKCEGKTLCLHFCCVKPVSCGHVLRQPYKTHLYRFCQNQPGTHANAHTTWEQKSVAAEKVCLMGSELTPPAHPLNVLEMNPDRRRLVLDYSHFLSTIPTPSWPKTH